MAVLFVSCGFAFGQDLNDGLVAYYPFNGNANDESGNGNDGVLNGTNPRFSDEAPSGSGLKLSGDSWVQIPHSAAINPKGSRTLSFTFSGEDAGRIFSNRRENGNRNWDMDYLSEEIRMTFFQNFSSALALSIPNQGANLFQHMVIVLDSEKGMIECYIDGALIDNVVFGGNLPESSLKGWENHQGVVPLDIGREVGYADTILESAVIDELRFYDRALSESEVTALYALDSKPLPVFQIIEGNFTWQEAKADAETKGGRLAVLDTQAKIDAANAFIQPDDPGVWIGLTDEAQEGQWKWITGEPLTVRNWYEGEPNNFGNEDYATVWSDTLAWNDAQGSNTGAYLLEILDQTPAVPFVAIDPLYESPSGESITLDATPTVGFPTEFTYQWCFNGFKIPANLGGTASSINIDNLQANEGTWSVSITNSEGIFEQDFEYRLYADSDFDGLSDAFEELISETDIDKEDTDDDGLGDADEVNTYRTNPNSPDSDSDGFTDLYELETAYDPNSAESVPDALVEIMTAIEVKFNAALGATYVIEFSTDNQTWDVIEDDIVGEEGAIERLYSKQEYPTGFFRVERKDE